VIYGVPCHRPMAAITEEVGEGLRGRKVGEGLRGRKVGEGLRGRKVGIMGARGLWGKEEIGPAPSEDHQSYRFPDNNNIPNTHIEKLKSFFCSTNFRSHAQPPLILSLSLYC